MAAISNFNNNYAVDNNTQGFWAKRDVDASPIWVSFDPGLTPTQKAAQIQDWTKRKSTQWLGNDATTYSKDIAKAQSSYQPSTVNTPESTTLFDQLLKAVDDEYASQRSKANQGYNTLVSQLKESRDLWNVDMERTYGSVLEKANVSVYDRGVEDSGIKGKMMTGLTEDKNYQNEQRDLLEKQKKQIASQDLKDQLSAISRAEGRAKLSLQTSKSESPYKDYNII